MRLKSGVHLKGIVPQMAIAALIVDDIYRDFGVDCWITSANDGRHSPTSLHYRDDICRAFDFRTHQVELDGREKALRDEVKAQLGDDFDVVLEDLGGPNEHLHVEYDPK